MTCHHRRLLSVIRRDAMTRLAHQNESGKALYRSEFGELREQLVYGPLDSKAVMLGTPDEAEKLRAIKCGTSLWDDWNFGASDESLSCPMCNGEGVNVMGRFIFPTKVMSWHCLQAGEGYRLVPGRMKAIGFIPVYESMHDLIDEHGTEVGTGELETIVKQDANVDPETQA